MPIPDIFVLPKNNDKNKFKKNVEISSAILQPKFSLGFHSFQHRTKNAMNITNKLETKNKFYNIVNSFDPEKIDIKKTISSGYYKMWEIISLFDLASKDKIVYGAIAEAPGAFIESYIDFRKKYFNISKDKIYSVTLKPEKESSIEDMNKKFMGILKKEYSEIYTPHKTSVKSVAVKYTGKDNGDITDSKTIKNFKKDFTKDNNLADLITADGSKYIFDRNFIEQESFNLIFGEIVAALSVQAKGGNFVLKIFDTFTSVSVKLMYLLSKYYDKVYVYKPFTSYENEEEKYLICKNFQFTQKEIEKELKDMNEMLQKMDTDEFISDIFSDMIIPDMFNNMIKFININLIINTIV